MLTDDDDAVALKELGSFAVQGEEGALRALQALRAMHGYTLAGQRLRQRIDLALDAVRPFRVDVDQPLSGVAATEL